LEDQRDAGDEQAAEKLTFVPYRRRFHAGYQALSYL
jgi:hypothetical protein